MTKENEQKLKDANADWDRANRECVRLLDAMAITDIESPIYGEMLGALSLAQERRTKAGDTISEVIFGDAAEFEAKLAREKAEVAV